MRGNRQSRPTRGAASRVARLLWACALAARAAGAADSTELWPEVSLFRGLGEQTRLYLDTSWGQGKESDVRSADVAAYLDISLKPIVRPALLSEDWQRSRYFWARVGYDRVSKSCRKIV